MRSFAVLLVSIGVLGVVCPRAVRADPTQQFAIESVAADGSGATRLAASPWPLAAPAFSPDGRTVAFVDDLARVEVVGADGIGERGVGEIGAGLSSAVVFAPVWSPDGSALLVPALGYPGPDPRNATPTLYAVEVSTGSVAALHPGRYASFSRDGRYVAYQVGDRPVGGGEIGVCRTDGSRDTPFGPGSYAAWSPTANRVAYVTRPGYLTISNATGAARWTVRGMTAGPIAWFPDGRTIVFARGGGRPAFFLVSVRARTVRRLVGLPAESGAAPSSVSASADGRWIAAAYDSSTVIVRSNGTHLQVIRADAAAWSPKSATLALIVGNTLSLWTPTGGAHSIYAGRQRLAEPAWSPDGTRIVVVDAG